MSRKTILLFLLIFPLESYAQTACPQGVAPGDPRCGPGGGGGGGWDLPAGKVYTRWKSTWGAMVEDTATGNVGTSTGQSSRRKAVREALAKCKAMGAGLECKYIYTYTNSCAVVAEPIEVLRNSVSAYQNGETVEAASKLAIAGCSVRNGGRACQVYYSNCTAPILIRE
jgi:hypothetical protein